MDPMFLIIAAVVVAVIAFAALINRYRRCPSDKILVIYGSKSNKSSAKCVCMAVVPSYGLSSRTMLT